MPGGQINELMDLWAAKGGDPPFANHKDLYDTIDSTPLGDAPWKSFSMSYAGPMPDEDIPPWMLEEFEVWHRDPRIFIQHQLANPDFVDRIHYVPYQEFGVGGEQRWQDLMSANWTWKQAVHNISISLYANWPLWQDLIAKDPDTHRAMFVLIILGSDKTTVSVGTGHTQYYPLYASLRNVHNSIWSAHRNAVTLIGFLAIPKSQSY